MAGVRGAALALTIVVAGLILAAPADAALRFKRCGGYGFKCARLSVPLDRAGALPGRVSLLVKRFAARRHGGATQPPLFVLAGGPGQSATDAFGGRRARRPLSRIREARPDRVRPARHRALGPAALPAPGASEPAARRGRGRRLRELGSGRAGPSTRAATRPTTSRRSASSWGRSASPSSASRTAPSSRSGTRSAIRRALSASCSTRSSQIDGPDPYYLDSVAASRRALRSLCRRDCSWTGDPVGELGTLVARIAASGPLRGRLVDARGSRGRAASRASTCSPSSSRATSTPRFEPRFPGAVHSALGGDAAPLLRLRRRAFEVDAEPPPPRQLSTAVYAATTCEEAPLPVVARDAARPSRAAQPGRRAAAGDPGLAVRSLRPRDRAGERHAEPLRALAAGAGGARLRSRPAAGRAGADARGRGRPPHPGRERRADGGSCSRARGSSWRPPRGTRRSAPTSTDAPSGRSRASFSGGPCPRAARERGGTSRRRLRRPRGSPTSAPPRRPRHSQAGRSSPCCSPLATSPRTRSPRSSSRASSDVARWRRPARRPLPDRLEGHARAARPRVRPRCDADRADRALADPAPARPHPDRAAARPPHGVLASAAAGCAAVCAPVA